MANVSSLQDWYIDCLRDIYDAETRITEALPKMEKAATTPALKNAFKTHLTQTEEHVKRLERVFEITGQTPRGKKCKAMEGLLKEGAEILDENMAPEVRDAALIGAAQKVEHYEIASYGTIRTYAELLGQNQAAKLLEQTLNEEKETDKLLTSLAESRINKKAEEPAKSKR